jgi:hypothetical protein
MKVFLEKTVHFVCVAFRPRGHNTVKESGVAVANNNFWEKFLLSIVYHKHGVSSLGNNRCGTPSETTTQVQKYIGTTRTYTVWQDARRTTDIITPSTSYFSTRESKILKPGR